MIISLLWVIPTTTQYSGIVSDISFGNGIYNHNIYNYIYSDSLSAFFLALMWHTFWNLFWHSIWHLCRHSLRHSVWHSLWRAQLHPELAVGFGSRRALSHHELAEEEGGRRTPLLRSRDPRQVGNSTIPTNIYSEFIRLYLLLQPRSPTVLPYSHVFTAYQ